MTVTVAGDEGSPRLDRVLAARLPELSRSRLKALILAGQVSLGSGAVRDPAYHVAGKWYYRPYPTPYPLGSETVTPFDSAEDAERAARAERG